MARQISTTNSNNSHITITNEPNTRVQQQPATAHSTHTATGVVSALHVSSHTVTAMLSAFSVHTHRMLLTAAVIGRTLIHIWMQQQQQQQCDQQGVEIDAAAAATYPHSCHGYPWCSLHHTCTRRHRQCCCSSHAQHH